MLIMKKIGPPRGFWTPKAPLADFRWGEGKYTSPLAFYQRIPTPMSSRLSMVNEHPVSSLPSSSFIPQRINPNKSNTGQPRHTKLYFAIKIRVQIPTLALEVDETWTHPSLLTENFDFPPSPPLFSMLKPRVLSF